MENRGENIVFFYHNAFLHLEFARINACNKISLVYTENVVARVKLNGKNIEQKEYEVSKKNDSYKFT